MKVGIFGGGFKPFTTGHFSKVSLSLIENDITYLFYGVSPRMKNSEFLYTREMAESVFEIVKDSMNKKFGDKIIVKKGVPNPLVEMFKLIESAKNGDHKFDRISLYSEEEDLHRFTKYIGTKSEENYFGDLVSSERLVFKSSDIGSLTSSMKIFYPDLCNSKIVDLIKVRGSAVRSAILKNDLEIIKNYIPAFLFETSYNGNKSSDEMLKALCGG